MIILITDRMSSHITIVLSQVALSKNFAKIYAAIMMFRESY